MELHEPPNTPNLRPPRHTALAVNSPRSRQVLLPRASEELLALEAARDSARALELVLALDSELDQAQLSKLSHPLLTVQAVELVRGLALELELVRALAPELAQASVLALVLDLDLDRQPSKLPPQLQPQPVSALERAPVSALALVLDTDQPPQPPDRDKALWSVSTPAPVASFRRPNWPQS